MEKNNQYILSGAEVIVNAPEPFTSSATYPKSCTVVDRKHNRVVVTPVSNSAVPNKKVYQKGRVKVMTRKDGTYLLTMQIVAEVDRHEETDRLVEVKHALEATFEYDEQAKGGRK